MPTHKSIETIWLNRRSGLVVPGGTFSVFFVSDSGPYLQIKKKALAVEDLYKKNGVILSASSDLARLIADAKALSDSWLLDVQGPTHLHLFRVGYFNRIAEAVLPLQGVSDRANFLKALA